MNAQHETVSVKLVTIIAPIELRDRLVHDLRTLGASGYTQTTATGWGHHGTRQFGLIEGANVRLETLVTEELAKKILECVVAWFSDAAVVAFEQDVKAAPRHHFV